MGRISLLSDVLINKIAAGEVVERPASVLKELVENAVDADAQTVRVSLKEGGLSYISVVDDGYGMGRDDALLAMTRHATSKLRDAEGLFHILTKGFRGEALPSIASVSRFTMTTMERGGALGTRIYVEGGGAPVVEEIAAAAGTAIVVEDLFFSVPARRKFMRREQTELAHCEEALVRIALAHPEVGFFLEHEGRDVFASPACESDPRERIAAALGKDAYPHLIPIDERWLGIRIHGFIASGEYSLPNARGLYCFVNRRYVRDRGLTHAVQRGFLDTLPPGRQPVVVLFLELDPASVDVNVHPQKLEVRFTDAKGVYDALVLAVSKAIRGKLEKDGAAGAGENSFSHQAQYAQAVERYLLKAQSVGPDFSSPLLVAENEASLAANSSTLAIGFGQARPDVNSAPPPNYFSAMTYLGPLSQMFWVCEGKGGTLVILEPHAVFERLFFMDLHNRTIEGAASREQKKLFSRNVEVASGMVSRALVHRETLRKLGMYLAPFGAHSLLIEVEFDWLLNANWTGILPELLELLEHSAQHLHSAELECARRLACAGASEICKAKKWTHAEVEAALSELEQTSFDVDLLHGRVSLFQIPLLELVQKSAFKDVGGALT